ncbi:MAG: Uncharacterized protein XE11_2819 [Methanomicrobiales archaeon 53_19]|nr:MAG: Uncharacterized protein XE11_2819 [Methanomicrobiales archaeon 53_19]
MASTVVLEHAFASETTTGTLDVLAAGFGNWLMGTVLQETEDFPEPFGQFVYSVSIKSSSRITEIIADSWEEHYTPRTELGKILLALRKRAIGKGLRLLTAEEVLEEVRRRRGERGNEETDIP